MKPHQTFLELAAMAIDYPLSASERRHLDEHLAGCQDCVRSASALRADASAIGSLPPLTLSDRRGDLILAAVLRPATADRPLRLVAIAALLALLITGSIAVGAVLLNRMNDDLAIVVPVPSPTASPEPGPTASPSAAPSASPGPTPTDGPGGTLVVTTEDQQQSWVEVVAPDGSVTRLAQGSNAAWLDADTIVYECSQPSQSVCAVDLATPGSVADHRERRQQPRARARRSLDRVPSQRDRHRLHLDRRCRRLEPAGARARLAAANGRPTAPGWRARRTRRRSRWRSSGPMERACDPSRPGTTRHGHRRAIGWSTSSTMNRVRRRCTRSTSRPAR